MSTVSIYRRATDNLGDQISAPILYFPFLCAPGAKIVDVAVGDFDLKDKKVVVGGGGPIEIFKPRMQAFRLNGPEKLVAWGVGTNDTKRMYPDYGSLKDYDLVGCRDWKSPFDWVPCVSCMHKFFDVKDEPTQDVVQYIHYTADKVDLGFPSMENNAKDFKEVLKFLGSANVVVTNTYHGAYWATLLGKKVVIVNPWSTKFFYMRHRHVMCGQESVDKAIEKAICYPEALEECRLANTTFAAKVKELFGV